MTLELSSESVSELDSSTMTTGFLPFFGFAVFAGAGFAGGSGGSGSSSGTLGNLSSGSGSGSVITFGSGTSGSSSKSVICSGGSGFFLDVLYCTYDEFAILLRSTYKPYCIRPACDPGTGAQNGIKIYLSTRPRK